MNEILEGENPMFAPTYISNASITTKDFFYFPECCFLLVHFQQYLIPLPSGLVHHPHVQVGEHVIEGDVIVTVLLWIVWMKGDSPSRPVLNATLLSVAGISVCAVAMAAVM